MAARESRLIEGLVLLNCAGGMNQKNLYADDAQLQAMRPVFSLLEFLLKQRTVASFLFEKFRSKGNVATILREQVYINEERVTDELIDILYAPSSDVGGTPSFLVLPRN